MILQLVWSFLGSLGAGVVFNVSKKNLLWTGFSGMLGWLFFAAVSQVTPDVVLPSFSGAVAVGLYSEVMARVLKSPATVYTISGIFAIVPGITAYNAIQFLMEDNIQQAAGKAVETIAAAVSIAFGILLVTAVFRFAKSLGYTRKRGQ